MTSPDISIIIASWNTKQMLCRCLASIYQNIKNDLDFEIIVVDNNSNDDSCKMIKDNFPQVILIENSYNKGFSAAINSAISISKARYVLLLNSDTLILNKAIQKTLAFAENHTDAAVTGCKILNPDRTIQQSCFMFPSILNMLLSASYLYKIFPKNRFFGRERMTWWDRQNVRKVDVVTGCFMLVRSEAIQKAGKMDESFYMYGEETDWCYRFKQAGWENLFFPNAEIIHFGGASTRLRKAEMILQLRGSVLLFMKKHRSRVSYLFACVLVSLFFLARVPYHFFREIILSSSDAGTSIDKTYLKGAFLALLGAESLCLRK
jgi:GT2 family glycosyltransferase